VASDLIRGIRRRTEVVISKWASLFFWGIGESNNKKKKKGRHCGRGPAGVSKFREQDDGY